MAKHSIPKSGGTSKFRMVVIDAELQEGEIGQSLRRSRVRLVGSARPR